VLIVPSPTTGTLPAETLISFLRSVDSPTKLSVLGAVRITAGLVVALLMIGILTLASLASCSYLTTAGSARELTLPEFALCSLP
jgi:hypothetical protein